MNDTELTEMRENLGTIAQTLKIFREECVAVGFNKEETTLFCNTMLRQALENLNRREK